MVVAAPSHSRRLPGAAPWWLSTWYLPLVTSTTRGSATQVERDRALIDPRGGEPQRLADILLAQLRILVEQRRDRGAVGDHAIPGPIGHRLRPTAASEVGPTRPALLKVSPWPRNTLKVSPLSWVGRVGSAQRTPERVIRVIFAQLVGIEGRRWCGHVPMTA